MSDDVVKQYCKDREFLHWIPALYFRISNAAFNNIWLFPPPGNAKYVYYCKDREDCDDYKKDLIDVLTEKGQKITYEESKYLLRQIDDRLQFGFRISNAAFNNIWLFPPPGNAKYVYKRRLIYPGAKNVFNILMPVTKIRFLFFNLSKASDTTVWKTSSCKENVCSDPRLLLFLRILIIVLAISYRSSLIAL